ncbi:MAG: hypothetical protein K6C11_04370 [Bacilli bacterium]|nr:hypothetical protein [Bacilli bacterium]
MSKIQELINDNNTILVFDVDGTLARMEYGEYNHFALDDDSWTKLIESGEAVYPDSQAIPSMVEYMKNKDMNNIYVCSKSYTTKEDNMKTRFLMSAYNILEDHIFYSRDNDSKLDVLNRIKEIRNITDDHMIAIVDDSLEVLNHIKENSNYSTIHISSFM